MQNITYATVKLLRMSNNGHESLTCLPKDDESMSIDNLSMFNDILTLSW